MFSDVTDAAQLSVKITLQIEKKSLVLRNVSKTVGIGCFGPLRHFHLNRGTLLYIGHKWI